MAITVAVFVLLVGSAGGAAAQGRPAYMSDPHAARIERLVAAGKRGEAYGVAKKAPESSSASVMAWIKANTSRVSPLFLYELSRRIFARDKDEAMMWFFAGWVRAVYDASRCSDRTAARGLKMLPFAAPKVAAHAQDHWKTFLAARRRALAWEAKQTGDTDPRWICLHGMEAYRAAAQGKAVKLRLEPRSKWPAIRRKIQAGRWAGIA